MLLRVIMSVIIVLLCIVALISPVLVDAHRWRAHDRLRRRPQTAGRQRGDAIMPYQSVEKRQQAIDAVPRGTAAGKPSIAVTARLGKSAALMVTSASVANRDSSHKRMACPAWRVDVGCRLGSSPVCGNECVTVGVA